MTEKTVAIIQPYFFPYLGYYALFERADEVVILDCVQFPRRGRVHRCELSSSGAPTWLTLPLAKADRSITINELRFADRARRTWADRLARQNWYGKDIDLGGRSLHALLDITTPGVADYLCTQIAAMCGYLGITCRISRSSGLALDPALKAQDRILAIARKVGATRYINPPGGRLLYQDAAFEKEGLSLRFLPPYNGAFRFVLPALAHTAQRDMQADLAQYSGQPLVKVT